MKRSAIFILLFTSIFISYVAADDILASSEVKINLALSGIDEVDFGFSTDPAEFESINEVSLKNIETNGESIRVGTQLYLYYKVQSDKNFTITLKSGPLTAIERSDESIRWGAVWPYSNSVSTLNTFFGGDDYTPMVIYEHDPSVSIGDEGVIPVFIFTEDLTYAPVLNYTTTIVLSLNVEGGNE